MSAIPGIRPKESPTVMSPKNMITLSGNQGSLIEDIFFITKFFVVYTIVPILCYTTDTMRDQIRNFSIIAHIDHGKSTLSDRMLDAAGSVEERKMQDQMLDTMELERERGITIKMQPVRMEHTSTENEKIYVLKDFRALVFDFKYHPNKGIIVFVRILDGEISKNTPLLFKVVNEKFTALEVGTFSPEEVSQDKLVAGEIGYIVTGIKKPGVASVGDTLVTQKNQLEAFGGYENPRPVVWASVYPESQDEFEMLKPALEKLKLTDSSLSYEEESSGSLGRGFRCGFLGMLHMVGECKDFFTNRLRWRDFTNVFSSRRICK